MPLLAEYAITPDVFDVTSYAHEDACDAELRAIKDVLLTEGLVRNLRKGEWGQLFTNDGRQWHDRGKELLKKLAQQNRLVRYPGILDTAPDHDQAWCEEALGTHGFTPFTGGVIVTKRVKEAFSTSRSSHASTA